MSRRVTVSCSGLCSSERCTIALPLAAIVCALLVLAACATVPYTGRRQLAIMSESEERAIGEQLYGPLTRRTLVSRDARAREIVNEVGRRIAAAAEEPGWNWEFTLFDDRDQVNAWALPGGKVGVYTGIFPVARDEAGLATIVGHEVAHAVAHHGAERTSQGTLLGILGAGLSIGAAGRMDPGSVQLLERAYGLGAQLGVILPFSRTQESEADEIGLILMAKAGYDPRAALEVWDRMAEVERKQAVPPEFLSTHPSYGTRITRIRESIPRALSHHQGGRGRNRRLPTLDEMAQPERAEAELLDTVARLDKLAVRDQESNALAWAIATEFGTSSEKVVQLARDQRLSPGETALAMALARSARTTVGSVLGELRRSRRWYDVVSGSGASPTAIVADLKRIAERAERGQRPGRR